MFTNIMGNKAPASPLTPCDITDLEDLLLDTNGLLIPVEAKNLKDIPHKRLQYFCHVYGFYSIPTLELIEFISNQIGDKANALEIGAGNGVYGRSLGIRSTDNFMQHPKNRAKFRNTLKVMESANTEAVPYGPNVEEMDGIEAIRKYKPSVVVAAWVTHRFNAVESWRGGNMFGVNFPWIIKRKGVDKIILIGNDTVQTHNPIMEIPHEKYDLDGCVFSRATDNTRNYVYIWGCSKFK